MEPSTLPVTSIKTGVTHEERSFDWEISNFPVVLKHRAMIKSQRFQFDAGESIGMASKWEAFLQAAEADGGTSVGIYIRLRERPVPVGASGFEHLCAQFIFTFKNKEGVVKKTFDGKVLDFYDPKVVASPKTGFGFGKVVNATGELPAYVELTGQGSLVIHVTFRLFALSNPVRPLKVKLEEFEVRSKAKARENLPLPTVGSPVASKSVKIIANDRKEIWIQRDVLSRGSPVFRAMLDADMTEGNDGVIEISDMGSKSLKTMLHFMSRGELIPEWTLSEVIVELTNAAGKYELTDLLQFLDGVLGDVCNLGNVGLLLTLAGQLSLKTAEKDLMCYLRGKGVNSPENFRQVLNGVLASESQPGGASGTSVGPGGGD